MMEIKIKAMDETKIVKSKLAGSDQEFPVFVIFSEVIQKLTSERLEMMEIEFLGMDVAAAESSKQDGNAQYLIQASEI